MTYAVPRTIDNTLEVDGVTHTTTYYQPPLSVSGVVDESYPEYNSTTTYNLGDYVYIDTLKKMFRCAADNITGKHPISNPDVWIDYGAINSWRMLSADEFINGKTTGEDIVIELDMSRCDTFGLVNIDFTKATITYKDLDADTIVVQQEIDGREIGTYSYSEYYYTDYKAKSRILITGLEWLPNASLTITFEGSVSIGGIVSGLMEDMGVTLYGTSLKFEDTSKVVTSEITGARHVVRYGSVRVVNARVSFTAKNYSVVANSIERIIGKNILWIPTALDKFTETIVLGYIESMDLPISNPVNVQTDTTIIGVL